MKKKKKSRRRRISIAQAVRVKEITVRFGGVIRTGNYENKRLSFEVTADCPRNVNPDLAMDYVEALAAQHFFSAQIKELENLPDEMRDEVDISKLTPGEAAAKIASFFKTFGSGRVLTADQKKQRIKDIDRELEELAPQIQAENKRLKKIKNVTSEDIHPRAQLIQRRDNLRTELKQLRR